MTTNLLDQIQVELIAMGFEANQQKHLKKTKVIEAYQTRFPTCQHPTIKTYEDGSSICICPRGAIGELDQQPSTLPWTECLDCPMYQKKKT